MNSFSYDEYISILKCLNESNYICDFKAVNSDTERFAVIRHDVEFSVERAFKMAGIEKELGLSTSYLFQLRNNAYNLLSNENIEMVTNIYEMGHKIGLHVHLGKLDDFNNIKKYILHDIEVIEGFLPFKIDRFSFHRPPDSLLKENIMIPNLINTYDKRFFHFIEKDSKPNEILRVKYFSDSMHQWKYGYPSEEELRKHDKIQLLVHPYSWTEHGYKNKENFYSLKDEKILVFNKTIRSECKHFNEDFR